METTAPFFPIVEFPTKWVTEANMGKRLTWPLLGLKKGNYQVERTHALDSILTIPSFSYVPKCYSTTGKQQLCHCHLWWTKSLKVHQLFTAWEEGGAACNPQWMSHFLKARRPNSNSNPSSVWQVPPAWRINCLPVFSSQCKNLRMLQSKASHSKESWHNYSRIRHTQSHELKGKPQVTKHTIYGSPACGGALALSPRHVYKLASEIWVLPRRLKAET